MIDISERLNKKLDAIASEIPNVNLIEVLNDMIATLEMQIVIEGYSDNKIHKHDARVELIALYKAYGIIEKENRK